MKEVINWLIGNYVGSNYVSKEIHIHKNDPYMLSFLKKWEVKNKEKLKWVLRN